MKREELGDLMAFVAVAEERSFTRAAARMGTSQSALSHTIRRLEERMGVRLLTRTTRNVAPTHAGEQLLATLRPAFDDIEARIRAVSVLGDRPTGTIRITASRQAAMDLLMPVTSRLIAEHPGIEIEISVDQRLTDIVSERYDAGVRLGEEVDRDMIAVRIGPDLRMAVVGAPAYFDRHPVPRTPHDLTGHDCLNLRLPTLGGIYVWEFEKEGRPLNVRVSGRFTTDHTPLIVGAALDGLGLACLPEDQFGSLIAEGRLVRVLEDWCPPFPGYHLYYPSRRQVSLAFRLLVDALRARAGSRS
ncbi:LysR family transcriptional regulator [Tistrella mobilis]|uniref:LysR family transcriptional regulator n=1 Tax=Tistrella mobilis TaxID=171437 RepID=UPI0035567423